MGELSVAYFASRSRPKAARVASLVPRQLNEGPLFCLPRSRRFLGRGGHKTLQSQINRDGSVHLVIVGNIVIKQAEF